MNQVRNLPCGFVPQLQPTQNGARSVNVIGISLHLAELSADSKIFCLNTYAGKYDIGLGGCFLYLRDI
jgi:hypothetical protein